MARYRFSPELDGVSYLARRSLGSNDSCGHGSSPLRDGVDND
jgi:hypothetical protein